MTKSNKTNQEAPVKGKKNNKFNVVGVLQLFVLASICYSTYVVYLGTDGIAPKVMLIPQALWATLLAVQKFTKSK